MTVPPWLSSNSFAAFDGWLPPLCWRPQPSLTGTLASHFTCAPPQEISNLGRPVKMAPVLQPGSNPRIPAPAAWFKQRVRVAAAKIEKQGYSYDELDLCLTAGTSTGRLSHSDSVLAPLRQTHLWARALGMHPMLRTTLERARACSSIFILFSFLFFFSLLSSLFLSLLPQSPLR